MGTAAALGVVFVIACLSATSWAGWLSEAIGSGSAVSQTIPQGAAPVAVAVGRDVTVTWHETELSGGTPAAGYRLKRYATGSSTPAAMTTTCTGVITTLSCVETGVPPGSWRYTVTPDHYGWTGTESAFGSSVSVGSATLAFTSSTTIPVATLPAALTGDVSLFLSNEAITFHLDGPTGPTLSGSPAAVGAGGSAAVSVTIPAGTDDAPHSVFVVGAGGSEASAAFTILDPPVLATLAMFDVNANGKVDRVVATFSKPLGVPYTAGVGPWTIANAPSGALLASVSVGGNSATLDFTEGAGAATTAVGSFTVALASNSGGIRDVNGQTASFAATAPADTAPPALTAAPQMFDTTANGRVDQVTLALSEPIAAHSAGMAPWTLANVPSGGTLSGVAAPTGGTAATLTITEGAGALDTAVGAFTLSLTANAAGLRDTTGNMTSFTGVVPADKAKPIRVSQVARDANANAKFDRVDVTFSESLATYTAGTTGWTMTSPPTGTTIASVAVSGPTATLTLNEGTTQTTALGSWTIALATNAGGIRDSAANLASYTAIAPTDAAAPVPTSVKMQDIVAVNGVVDRVAIVYSETLATYTAGTTPWTLTNVPSGSTLTAATVTTTTVNLTLASPTGPADTSVGAFTVAMASTAGGVGDAAGNLTPTMAATSPLDGAAPFKISQSAFDGNGNGKFDRVEVNFSESLATYTAGNAPWTLSTVPTGMTLASVAVSGAKATLTVNEGTTQVTSVGSWRVALASNAAGIHDAAGNLSAYAAVAPADAAAPVPISVKMQDVVTVDGFVDRVAILFSETLGTYTAGTTPWTLANVPSGASLTVATVSTATVNLTLASPTGPADTAVGGFTVAMASNPAGVDDAAGNAAASFGPTTPIDGAAPLRVSQSAFDGNGNAKFDRVEVNFSEALATYTAGTTPWTMTAPPAGMTLASVAVTGTKATLTLNEGTAQLTSIGTWKVALATNAAGIRDATGNLSSYAAVVPADAAAPVPISVTMQDLASGDGIVDRVAVLFSETLSTYTAGTTPWTLTNVPSGSTVSAAALSTATINLTLASPTGPADTTVGSFTVAMAANASGARDAAGNSGSFAPTTPIDGAGPAAIALSSGVTGTTAGRIEPGDTLSVTLSEPLGSGVSLPSTTTVTLADPSGSGSDTLAVPGLFNGARSTGSNLYVGTNATTADFASSTLTLSPDRRTITVTVGPACSGTGCASLGTATATAVSVLLDATLKDEAAVVPTTVARNISARLF